METFKLPVMIDQTTALAAGKIKYGKTEYAPSEAELAELTTDERVRLVKGPSSTPRGAYVQQNAWHLASPAVEWPAIVARLREVMKLEADAQREEAEDRAKKIMQIYVDPIAAIREMTSFETDRYRRWPELADAFTNYDAEIERQRRAKVDEITKSDDPIKAAQALARAEFWGQQNYYYALASRYPELAPLVEKAKAAEKAERDAEEAKKEAIKERARLGALAYAREIDELARAATEKYDVAAAVADHVAETIADASPKAFVLREGSPEYEAASWQERSAPRASAFVVLDRIEAHIAALRKPDGFEIEAQRVMRFDPGEDRDGEQGQKFTAVIVTIESPITKDRVVVIPAE